MGSAPQQAGSPSQAMPMGTLARILSSDAMNNPQMGQSLSSAVQSQPQQPSGMAPPPQPQSTPAPSQPQQPSQSNIAPITQQLQQATQPGSFAANMQQPLQSYYQNPLAMMLGGWGNG